MPKAALDPALLEQRIRSCRICAENPLKTPLPHAPRPVAHLSATARLCIAGQAPGLRVHNSGLPFDDPSGQRLRAWLAMDRETFYDRRRLAIVPMGFCFPGYDKNKSDLPPRPECRAAWHDEVFAAMPQIELVLAIGQYAQAYHLGKLRHKSMTETARDWRAIYAAKAPRHVLAMPHPSWRNTAWLKRNPWFEAEVVPFLQEEVRRLTAQ
ncbi:MAG: uracil-DNA glycosylase family protein [Pseudomonadota bacterium]